jgi:hypothetical protein
LAFRVQLSVLNGPHSGVEAPTPGDKAVTLARSSARAKVATAQRRGRAVANGLVARRPTTAAKRPSPGCTGDARRLTRRPCSRPNDEAATARSVAVPAGVGSAPAPLHPIGHGHAGAPATGCSLRRRASMATGAETTAPTTPSFCCLASPMSRPTCAWASSCTQHRHGGVGAPAARRSDAPRAVVAQAVQAGELDVGELAGDGVEHRQ